MKIGVKGPPNNKIKIKEVPKPTTKTTDFVPSQVKVNAWSRPRMKIQLDDENVNAALEMMGGEEVELPEKTGTETREAIIQNVLKTLVEKRKLVKNQIKGERG